MRIIAGEFRGRTLRAPKGDGTRPTTDRVREALMSAVASARGGFDDAVVLDAFAGSGALGLEALSRGAASVCFCERDGAALRVVEGNIRDLGVDGRRARVVRTDVLKGFSYRGATPFDLVFLDPPYSLPANDVLGMIASLVATNTLSVDALVVYEHAAASSKKVDSAAEECDLVLATRKKYGDTVVDMFRIQKI